jgi:TetR/AcrR family transcriptional regulator, transcriptional repressor for nem operon
MVRPRGFDSDQVSDALLDAFWRRGFARTSIADLTEATGLLPGSLYGAFGSKEEMFRVALARYVAGLAAELATERTGVAAIRHVLDTVVRLTADDPERRGCLILNAIPEAGALSADVRAELDRGLAAMRALIRARLAEAAGEAPPSVDLDALAALVFGASVSIRVLGRAGQDPRLLATIADGAVAAVRRCLARPRTEEE